MRGAATLLVATLLLAACGNRGPLVRLDAQGNPPPREQRAEQAKMTERALSVTPEARPRRVDDVLRRSEERPDDPFNLPPQR